MHPKTNNVVLKVHALLHRPFDVYLCAELAAPSGTLGALPWAVLGSYFVSREFEDP